MERTNALAELARELDADVRIIGAFFKSELVGSKVVCANMVAEIRKAQRIVAELAKVEKQLDIRTVGMTHLADILEADKNRAVEIVRNCRIIAMEGAGDGK